jgi:hypothetical protein
MRVSYKRGSFWLVALAMTSCAITLPAWADEIRLKDGKKLYGVIVSYEDNMFKVKTDFGYVLVEKDKIASIVPTTPTDKPEAQPAAKKDAASKPGNDSQPKTESAVASSSETSVAPTNASVKEINPATSGKTDKPQAKVANVASKPELPANAPASNAATTSSKGAVAPTTNGVAASAAALTPPKEPEVPANREEVQGNLYTNYTHGFRMYKAPSWNLLEEARSALPNAIVAMGTPNESTLLVVGAENTKDPLDVAAAAVEKRLHDVYSKYQKLSQRKTVVGGLPGIEYQYRGTADEHEWSGRLVVVARGKDILTVLGMTYADTDLIQIQENVIARAIASLDFDVH